MPTIIKDQLKKKTKNSKIKKTPKPAAKQINLPSKKAKNAPEYYLCMGNNCHGQNITQVAKKCKNNAPSLNIQRVKKIKELVKSAQVIGKFANDLEQVLKH
jgi:hypothetical protein